MSNNQSSQKSLAISICLLFLLVPLLGIIDFPEDLIETYQAHTKSNIDHLRKAGYEGKFTDIHDGIKQYLDQIVD